jgi:hypothetical protein
VRKFDATAHGRKYSVFAQRWIVAVVACGLLSSAPGFAAGVIKGQVTGGGAPITGSTVTLWVASTGAPKQLGQARTGDAGRFALNVPDAVANDATLYLVANGGQPAANKASGDNPAIALLSVVGSKPPANVVINEMTTVASVWTHAQFLNGTTIKGHALGLKIAAGNVPNFVDLGTGGWGEAIQGPLNSGQTPTMANFATLADVLSGCVTRIANDACSQLFAAATPPSGNIPTDTLTAAQSIARYPWYQPQRVSALLETFYPIPQGKTMRPVPYMPYLNVSPSAPAKHEGRAPQDQPSKNVLSLDQRAPAATTALVPTALWTSSFRHSQEAPRSPVPPFADAASGREFVWRYPARRTQRCRKPNGHPDPYVPLRLPTLLHMLAQ